MAINNQTVKFQRALTILRDPDASFTAEAIYGLSDLAGENLDAFRAEFPGLSAARRRDLLLRLVETAETNFELDFSSIIALALDDPEAEVRRTAVDGVLEDASIKTVERLVKLAQDDESTDVRASAVSALGMFILAGELGKLPERFSVRLQDTALALYNNPQEALDVRRRALEAISNCGREGVADLIREAYYSDDLLMRVSAVFAMGRSYDASWTPQVMEELNSDHPEMRFEAARSAGELELRTALPRLAELAYDDDREIQLMAIWSLGEIGGKAARNVLNKLSAIANDNEDDDLADVIRDAQSASMLSGEDMLPLFDFSQFDDEDDDLLDLEIDDEDEFDLDDEDDFDEDYDDEDEDDGEEDFAAYGFDIEGEDELDDRDF